MRSRKVRSLRGGASVEGDGATVVQGVPTAGVIPGGARIEREVAFDFGSPQGGAPCTEERGFHFFYPRPPGSRPPSTVRSSAASRSCSMPERCCLTLASTRRSLARPCADPRGKTSWFQPERRARVVVDQRSGTIVMGADVRISRGGGRVAVSQGNLTLRIEERPVAVQPKPLRRGRNGDRPAHRRRNRGGGWPTAGGDPERAPPCRKWSPGLNALGVSPRGHDRHPCQHSTRPARSMRSSSFAEPRRTWHARRTGTAIVQELTERLRRARPGGARKPRPPL